MFPTLKSSLLSNKRLTAHGDLPAGRHGSFISVIRACNFAILRCTLTWDKAWEFVVASIYMDFWACITYKTGSFRDPIGKIYCCESGGKDSSTSVSCHYACYAPSIRQYSPRGFRPVIRWRFTYQRSKASRDSLCLANSIHLLTAYRPWRPLASVHWPVLLCTVDNGNSCGREPGEVNPTQTGRPLDRQPLKRTFQGCSSAQLNQPSRDVSKT